MVDRRNVEGIVLRLLSGDQAIREQGSGSNRDWRVDNGNPTGESTKTYR
jgi:hypothetical protein